MKKIFNIIMNHITPPLRGGWPAHACRLASTPQAWVVFFIILFFSFTTLLFSQSTFQLAIGGNNSNYAQSIIHTTDGGYVVAGYTDSYGAGSEDFYIVKIDSIGSIQWTRTIGGTNIDEAMSIIQTTGGGYVAAGFTQSFGAGNYDMYIVKLNANGSLEWNKTIGGTGYDIAYSIIQATDGGYVVAGITNSFGAGNSDFFIVKLDTSGSLQWCKTIGGTGYEEANSVIQTTDGGYAVAGCTNSFGAGGYDMYIVKLDANGSLQWNKTIGGTGDDFAQSIIRTTDSGYAMNGATNSFGISSFFIVKLNQGGSLQWSKTIGVITDWIASSIIQSTDGGYAVAGSTTYFGAGSYDMYIVKLSENGSLEWDKTIGGTGSDAAYSMTQATDGGYVMAGETGSFGVQSIKMYIVKLNPIGITCGNTTTPTPTVTTPTPIVTTPSPTVTSPTPVVTTPTPIVSSGGTETIICTTVGLNNMQSKIPSEFKLYQNYPNPFNPTTKIKFDTPLNPPEGGTHVKLIIYDILGREVTTLVNKNLSAGSYEVSWDATRFPSGMYFYKIEMGDFVQTKKMILAK